MSDKFFFNGKPQKKPKHVSHSFSTQRQKRAGTTESPLQLTVTSEERKSEIKVLLSENNLVAEIIVDNSAEEDINGLDSIINTPKTFIAEKTPQRNDPCSCGSGKKYKKCCA